ncbi:unnamed protein product [Phytophthora fragariaefolia]|uniref:Unnamed protein product n=1 Tax=Phytophthora fragariaefolia TaxID=1490495 RepID=A0A9W6XCA0_9STRA|nr:unnamed protein product [Phytophthora fragariaefolia]
MSVLGQVLTYANGLKPHTCSYVKAENPETLGEAMNLAVNSEKKVGSSLSRNPSVLKIDPVFTARNLVTSGPTVSSGKGAGEAGKRATASVNEGPDVVERVIRTTKIENISLNLLCENPLVYKSHPLFSVMGDMTVGDTTISIQSMLLGCGATAIYASGRSRPPSSRTRAYESSLVITESREGAAGEACRNSSTKGKDTFVKKMFTLGVVDEAGIQTKYITRKKLRKFLRITTKSTNEPDFMLVLSNDTIKQAARSLQRRDQPDNVGSAKAQRYQETDWDSYRDNPAFQLLREYKNNVF